MVFAFVNRTNFDRCFLLRRDVMIGFGNKLHFSLTGSICPPIAAMRLANFNICTKRGSKCPAKKNQIEIPYCIQFVKMYYLSYYLSIGNYLQSRDNIYTNRTVVFHANIRNLINYASFKYLEKKKKSNIYNYIQYI